MPAINPASRHRNTVTGRASLTACCHSGWLAAGSQAGEVVVTADYGMNDDRSHSGILPEENHEPLFVFGEAFSLQPDLLAPLVWIDINSFWSELNTRWGWDNYYDILSSPFYQQAFRFSLDISFWSSVYRLLIAMH